MSINHLTFRVIGWVLFVSVFLAASRSIAADDTNQWNVQVTSLQIIAPHPKSTNEIREKLIHKMEAESDRLPGVAVKLRVTAPDGQIVGWNNDEDSSIQSFTDDKGSNLLAQASQENYEGESESGISSIGFTSGEPSLRAEIRAPNLPSKGAVELNIVGKISVQTATGSRRFIAENVKFKPGAEFNLGDLKLTVSDARIMDKDKTFGVTLDSKQDLSGISTLEFFDSRGNKIKPLVTSEDGDFRIVWLFQKPLERVKIRGTYWTGFKTTEVPIAVKTGLGL